MLPKIIEYKLLEVLDQTRHVIIQNMLEDGYQPYGSPTSVSAHSVVQAFVKYEEAKKIPPNVRRG